jgi:membrane protease YdiL (CAAX protease family)
VLKLEGLALGAELANMGLQNTPWLLFIFYYFIVNPILEELFWRGYLGSPNLKPAGSDFWYAGYHVLILVLFVDWPWIVLSFVTLVGAGWTWRQLARIYNGLTIPIVSHAAADAGIIGAVFFLAQ